MAETITFNVPRQSMVSNKSSATRGEQVPGTGNWYWYISFSQSSNSDYTLDVSAIPDGAEIQSVSYTRPDITTTYGGSPNEYFYNGSWTGITNAKLKAWLVAGNRSIRLRYNYKCPQYTATGWYSQAPAIYSSTCIIENIKIKVTYEGGGETTWILHYGIGGVWVEVEAYGAEEGTYKHTKAYYGIDNAWKELEKSN